MTRVLSWTAAFAVGVLIWVVVLYVAVTALVG
jgi:hypothetical protein